MCVCVCMCVCEEGGGGEGRGLVFKLSGYYFLFGVLFNLIGL